MDRPASLCWEGVALGWRETVPRPRSRGGEVLQKEHNGGLQRDHSGLHREHSSQGSHVMSSPSMESHQPASLRLDSGLNSLEYWDYSVELECLSGPEGRIDQIPWNTLEYLGTEVRGLRRHRMWSLVTPLSAAASISACRCLWFPSATGCIFFWQDRRAHPGGQHHEPHSSR